MSTIEKFEYYADTANRETRSDLVLATSLVGFEKNAIDCGCGAGSDIAYLRNEGFIVHAFDAEEESIKICNERFKEDRYVYLSKDTFSSFRYPRSTLVVADASLFFCPDKEFDTVWANIYKSLVLGGIFCGSFLGPNDTMASLDFDRDAYLPDVMVFEEGELRSKLKEFEVIRFTEHNVTGETPKDIPHQWHIYSVVAKKI
jgi:SAM-dependent methyltransferase